MKPAAGSFTLGLLLAAMGGGAQAQSAPITSSTIVAPATPAATGSAAGNVPWLSCARLVNDREARLACFDELAQQQSAPPAPAVPVLATASAALPEIPPQPVAVALAIAADQGCKDTRYSEFSRFWELETGSDCGTFNIRGYRPISLSVVTADNVNEQPSSPSAGHTATSATVYKRVENRIQVSVRTKIAQGMLTDRASGLSDSLWFGYTQQSYWQLFTPSLSRPFRSTDHEPELVYVYPSTVALPGGWKLRYSGAGLVHQSNGQSLPLSRSWNRIYGMAGLEQGDRWQLQARVWKRLPESNGNDDNPDISDYIGRAELLAAWNVNKDHTLVATLRHSLRSNNRGSVRLEWLQSLDGDGRKSGLRLHTQLFSGYGDSLIDYNHRRTVLSVGLSLVDF
ncbi:phospholipase A1 [Rhodoferax ferrireducens]|uniref:Phospholipase A1 n=1 Tax=Rhodoferax ferrireducens TaxID=192843 RepID=A0ABU2CEG3_9BURK|nr:phospholipase A [Rhodoferax ferrireducens]MDR7379703.1 phospholipase A1 [Rhodoferax ferrireducens]